MTVQIIHTLQAFGNRIFRTVAQQLTRSQPTTRVSRSLCYSLASCHSYNLNELCLISIILTEIYYREST